MAALEDFTHFDINSPLYHEMSGDGTFIRLYHENRGKRQDVGLVRCGKTLEFQPELRRPFSLNEVWQVLMFMVDENDRKKDRARGVSAHAEG